MEDILAKNFDIIISKDLNFLEGSRMEVFSSKFDFPLRKGEYREFKRETLNSF